MFYSVTPNVEYKIDEIDFHFVLFFLKFSVSGLFKLQDLVKSPPSTRTEMYIRQAGPGSYRQVLREIKHKEIYKLIIDTDPAHMQQFFRAVSANIILMRCAKKYDLYLHARGSFSFNVSVNIHFYIVQKVNLLFAKKKQI